MPIFDETIKKQLKEMLNNLKNNVNLLFFTMEFECGTCKDTKQFFTEFSELSNKLSLTIFDFQKNKDKSDFYGIDKIPAIVVLDKDDNDTGIRFYGIPGGYEINSLITSLNEVSGNREELPPDIINRIKLINKKIHIQVFITLTCPYCPQAVVTAHRLAIENNKITADMVESSTFPQLAIKYNVQGVPKIIINETHELVGAQPLQVFLDHIEKI